MLIEEHELIIKEFFAMAIGSIFVFSFLYCFLYLSELVILSGIRVVIFITKAFIKLATKTILNFFQATVRSLADSILRPFAPRMAASLKFRTFQLCRKVWIGVSHLLDNRFRDEEIIVDPTIYVYDPRGRTFISYNPNWKPMLGSYKRKLAKKRHLQKIRELQGRRDDNDDVVKGSSSKRRSIHPTFSAKESAAAACPQIPSRRGHAATTRSPWNTPPRQPIASTLTTSNRRIVKGGRSSPAPGSLAAVTDSDTDSHFSHGDNMSQLLLHDDDDESELCNSFTAELFR